MRNLRPILTGFAKNPFSTRRAFGFPFFDLLLCRGFSHSQDISQCFDTIFFGNVRKLVNHIAQIFDTSILHGRFPQSAQCGSLRATAAVIKNTKVTFEQAKVLRQSWHVWRRSGHVGTVAGLTAGTFSTFK
jgi:hypothetical protein